MDFYSLVTSARFKLATSTAACLPQARPACRRHGLPAAGTACLPQAR